MKGCHFLTLLAMAMAIPSSSQQEDSTRFVFNGFHNNLSDIRLSGIAVLDSSGSIQLTNISARIYGHALYRYPLLIKANDSSLITASFSTTFVFSISALTPTMSGHGLAFFLASALDDTLVSPVQYMGLVNSSSDGYASNHLFAVEFDTVLNMELQDIDGNHVGINVNSMTSVAAATAGYRTSSDPNQSQPLSLKGGQNIQAWIYYDSLSQQVNVSISNAGQPEPPFPLLSIPLNLSSILLNTAYVGFSAATGDMSAVHSILAWSFNSNGLASPLDLSNLPQSVATTRSSSLVSKGAIAGFTLLVLSVVCVAICALFFIYRRRKRLQIREKQLGEWEKEYGPQMFSYRELSEATKRFAEERLVGKGGFGAVYRGVLPRTGQEVAVKCLSKRSAQGVREFMAELSTIGRLSHRNLLQLQGWSKKWGSGELLLVYDYMPNGSLDKMLHYTSSSSGSGTDSATLALAWGQRYSIIKDVAAALVYLHEEWEEQVLHRDVKSNNILLDANMTAKLGDFGLARLHGHGKNSHTTIVAGTLGYLAPECTQTGKATTLSDVFSFGVVMLEVACGRPPLLFQNPLQQEEEEERILVPWVLGLLLKGRLLDACDPKLCGQYVVEEMERVLQLGLFCSNPNPAARPQMRQVLQILTGVAPLPVLPPFKLPSTTTSPGTNTAASSPSASGLQTNSSPFTSAFAL